MAEDNHHNDFWQQELPYFTPPHTDNTAQLPVVHGSPSFLDLPPELQTSITAWIHRPADLVRVCLVSKQLWEIVAPQLYHSVHLNVDRWGSKQIESILRSGHRGHTYVRDLDIDSTHYNSESRALEVAKDALAVMPWHQLQSFRCPLETGIDNDLMVLLAANQRKLSFIGLGPLLPGASDSVMDCLRPWPPQISTIVIPWKLWGWQDINFYRELIWRCRKGLRALTVRAHDLPPAAGSKQESGDTKMLAHCLLANMNLPECIAPICLNSNLQDHGDGCYFREEKIEEPHLTLQLHDLNLQNQDLDGIDIPYLQGLKSREVDEADQAPKHAEDYLAATSGLHYLNLSYRPVVDNPKLFPIKCLEGHKETIRDLFIGIGGSDPATIAVPRLSDIEWLVTNCPRLRQLAIPLPQIRLDYALAGRWDEYGEIISQLALLADLKVFLILSWPIIHSWELPSSWDNTGHEALKGRYLRELHIVASSIARLFVRVRAEYNQPLSPATPVANLVEDAMSSSAVTAVAPNTARRRCDSLSTITFGNTESPHWVPHYTGAILLKLFTLPITFRIKRVMGPDGLRTKIHRIEAAQMEYEEPIAYVVDEDTDQGLSLEAYAWGVRNRESV